jgi:hypothetical protein
MMHMCPASYWSYRLKLGAGCASAALVLQLLSGGCGTTAPETAPAPPTLSLSQPADSIAIVGASAAQEALLQEIMTGLGSTQIQTVELGQSEEPPPDHLDARFIRMTIRAADRAHAVKGYWQALLLAGAFRDLGYQAGLPPLYRTVAKVRYPDGDEEDLGSSVIGQPFVHDIALLTEDELTREVARAAAGLELKITSISFVQPHNRGIMIQARTDDARDYAINANRIRGQLFERLVAHTRPLVEGTYLEVRDASNELVEASGYSVRTGGGVGWLRPALRNP